jgi:hypothetical protein
MDALKALTILSVSSIAMSWAPAADAYRGWASEAV